MNADILSKNPRALAKQYCACLNLIGKEEFTRIVEGKNQNNKLNKIDGIKFNKQNYFSLFRTQNCNSGLDFRERKYNRKAGFFRGIINSLNDKSKINFEYQLYD